MSNDMNVSNRNAFGHNTTADQVLAGIDLRGRRVLITGATSGIGEETARAMASKGAQVILTARNMPKGEAVVKQIQSSTGNQQVEVMPLELGSIANIRAFARAFLTKYDSLNLLINNAGVMACPFGKTEDGFERQFGVNHLGHFFANRPIDTCLDQWSSRSYCQCEFSRSSHVSACVRGYSV